MLMLTHLNFVAIILAVAISFLFGWIWFGPLFGKRWRSLSNLPLTQPGRDPMAFSIVLSLVGSLLGAIVLSISLTIMHHHAEVSMNHLHAFYCYSFCNAFLAWLGFCLPLNLNAVAWDKKPWELFYIQTSYNFLNLQIMAFIIAYFI